MKKMIVLAVAAMMALSGTAFADGGIQGDCYDCHTMHNSEEGQGVLKLGAGGAVTTGTPMANLLKFDCMACHANNPTGGTKTMSLPGGSTVPQVAHGGATLADSLAGGNFSFGMGSGTSRKVHNVNDLFAGIADNNTGAYNEPPGLYHSEDRGAFTSDGGDAFDNFTCAGARGCHGTRNQILAVAVDNGTNNVYGGTWRTGITAISGAHHVNSDGDKTGAVNYTAPVVHSGAAVADGYRFIVGLKGYENETDRWQNVDKDSHNEYYGVAGGLNAASCGTCHITGSTDLGDNSAGLSSRFTTNSTIITPNQSMSGFCSSCHSNFHSGGSGGDTANNGVSGAFLRHPSDYVLNAGQGAGAGSNEYLSYTEYDVTAPVARPSGFGWASGDSSVVTPATDMVMCLSCHVPHGSPNDFLLRFDYGDMTAGGFADAPTAQLAGGCMACHSKKGIQQ
jgi:predicted CXXCH cytochrome family protein